MSWGYWGIVAGLLVLLTVFFFCMDLLYDARQEFAGTVDADDAADSEGAASSGKKHAA